MAISCGATPTAKLESSFRLVGSKKRICRPSLSIRIKPCDPVGLFKSKLAEEAAVAVNKSTAKAEERRVSMRMRFSRSKIRVKPAVWGRLPTCGGLPTRPVSLNRNHQQSLNPPGIRNHNSLSKTSNITLKNNLIQINPSRKHTHTAIRNRPNHQIIRLTQHRPIRQPLDRQPANLMQVPLRLKNINPPQSGNPVQQHPPAPALHKAQRKPLIEVLASNN